MSKRQALRAPFPYFGGKSWIAAEVWKRFGEVTNFVEPFFGSGACLLARPTPFNGVETVNDKDGFIANFWRAVQRDPETVAANADRPVFENDLHAWHIWLVERATDLQAKLEGDPDYFDAKIAGVWCWGLCCWIGGKFCSGKGPWQSVEVDGVRQRVHLGGGGRGVTRQLVHLNGGQGVNRQGVTRQHGGLYDWFDALAARLRHVRVCSGDWSRVMGPSVTTIHGLTAIFLDPPYADTAGRESHIYTHDCLQVAHDVRDWAVEHGDNPLLRIALCGYEGEHEMPPDWECLEWKATGGYGSAANDNSRKERIWFSPACVRPRNARKLFDLEAVA